MNRWEGVIKHYFEKYTNKNGAIFDEITQPRNTSQGREINATYVENGYAYRSIPDRVSVY
jgi:hypothetical protein